MKITVVIAPIWQSILAVDTDRATSSAATATMGADSMKKEIATVANYGT